MANALRLGCRWIQGNFTEVLDPFLVAEQLADQRVACARSQGEHGLRDHLSALPEPEFGRETLQGDQ